MSPKCLLQREDLFTLPLKYSICCTPSPHPYMLCSVGARMPKRILIVEDEVSVRNAVRAFLEHQSCLEVCGEAANGLEALEKATALRPDIVLLDLSMPLMNGVEVASLIRTRIPNTLVVVYTMFDDVLGKLLAATLGIAAIVSKSDGLATLLARIEALLESSTLVQPPV
jgi:DNA-binding NarL/FixJ family response regulator